MVFLYNSILVHYLFVLEYRKQLFLIAFEGKGFGSYVWHGGGKVNGVGQKVQCTLVGGSIIGYS